MRLKKIINLPIFDSSLGLIVGQVVKVAINRNYELDYVVIDNIEKGMGMIMAHDFVLTSSALIINSGDCIKKHNPGEELSMYQEKVGDKVFDSQGRELGIVSDLIVSTDSKAVKGVEISSGAIIDLLEGRPQISLENVCWTSTLSAIVNHEGSK